jgi:hypothetical protein
MEKAIPSRHSSKEASMALDVQVQFTLMHPPSFLWLRQFTFAI